MKSKPNMTAQDWDEYYATRPDVPDRRLLHRHKILPKVFGIPHSILDVGCGAGEGLLEMQAHFPSALLWGVDFSAEAIRACRERIPVGSMFRQYDITQEDLHFCADLVMCVQTLEHFAPRQIPWIMARLFQAARHQLLISVPYKNMIADRDHKTQFDERSFGVMSPDIVSVESMHMTFGWIRR